MYGAMVAVERHIIRVIRFRVLTITGGGADTVFVHPAFFHNNLLGTKEECSILNIKNHTEKHIFFCMIFCAVRLFALFEPFSRGDDPPRPPPLTLRRQPRRNFPLQFFFCARTLKKIQKRKGKFLLGSAQEVSGRCGGASTLGQLGIPPPNPLLPSCPRFGEWTGKH
jgi:hypothetical protein